MYFIFCRTSPPDMHSSSHRTTTTFCPFNTSFAIIDASRPSMWCLASTTTLFEQIPDPETILLSLSLSLSRSLSDSNPAAASLSIYLELLLGFKLFVYLFLRLLLYGPFWFLWALSSFSFLLSGPINFLGFFPFFRPLNTHFAQQLLFFLFFFFNY